MDTYCPCIYLKGLRNTTNVIKFVRNMTPWNSIMLLASFYMKGMGAMYLLSLSVILTNSTSRATEPRTDSAHWTVSAGNLRKTASVSNGARQTAYWLTF